MKEVKKTKKTKCLVWDLDNTLWSGTLIEGDRVTLRENVVETIKTLDSRGILQSIASKNDYSAAMSKLREFGLEEFFLYPQINWGAKSESIKKIAELINIGADTLAFIDDQEFELDEVSFSLPEVLCIHATSLDRVAEMEEMNPVFITEDSKNRRLMYMADMNRNKDEESYDGPKEEFLSTLGMVFDISLASTDDLKRAEELTVRTNQLNTTGYTYSYDELDGFIKSSGHLLLIASLSDRYGSYGKIGLVLIEVKESAWIIKLLLMSCRVMSRGVGAIVINYLRNEARKRGVRLLAEMIQNDRNRMMYVTYKFSGFNDINRDGQVIIMEDNSLADIPPYPDFVKLRFPKSL
ncbi:MAG: HAD-IIIC family phosphatase [Nitrospirae bacterium]|nr:HAD-IIIC family phosphatase [Nitrospirota bacterium]MBF0536213.1 HAD-IIIC family phosphatase [Nitrospirota bacterium]MBF0617311.1 HAD-IIIC family phosphatase [Nitrospirota bacterium]